MSSAVQAHQELATSHHRLVPARMERMMTSLLLITVAVATTGLWLAERRRRQRLFQSLAQHSGVGIGVDHERPGRSSSGSGMGVHNAITEADSTQHVELQA